MYSSTTQVSQVLLSVQVQVAAPIESESESKNFTRSAPFNFQVLLHDFTQFQAEHRFTYLRNIYISII